MSDDGYLSWNTGLSVLNPRSMVRMTGISDHAADAASYIGSIPIVVNENMPEDQVIMLPTGKAVMNPDTYAALMNNIGKMTSQEIEDAVLGVKEILQDPEKDSMHNNELWGSF